MRLGAAVVIALAAAGLPLVTSNTYYLLVAMLIGITTIVATGLNILAGSSGQVSLGHAGLYALGAYAGAILATRVGLGFWTVLPIAVVLGALVGGALALASLRVTGPYLAMVTIAFGIIVQHGLIEWEGLTRGFGGIADIPKAHVGSLVLTLPLFYYVVGTAVVVSLLLARNFERSAWGRAVVAVRESEIAAASLGLNAYAVRAMAFTLSAGFAAAGGCLYAFLTGFVSPDSFTFEASIVFLLVVLFGGLGRVTGSLVGSIVLVVLPEVLQRMSDYRLILYGSLLLGTIYFLPQGVVGALGRKRAHAIRRTEAPTHVDIAPSDRVALHAHALDMRFGGLVAVSGVDLALTPGAVHGLIGPNGAGKTTMLNLLTGFYRPSAGSIRVGDRELDGSSPYRIARTGIGRTFQTTQLFDAMTVAENVEVGLAGASTGSVLAALLGARAVSRREERLRAEALALLAFVGYAGDPDELARNLPFGVKRLVEIARALARRPSVLLLDEPAAGLSHEEIERLGALITRIRDAGAAVLLVAHHMDLVMGVSDRVTVLNYGRTIAEGAPAAVQRDPAVIEAYLGERRGEPAAALAVTLVATASSTPSSTRVEPLLAVDGLAVAHGRMEVVKDLAFDVHRGEIVVIIGANGAGKTTTLRTLAGLGSPRRGRIRFAGQDITGRPAHWLARHGIALVPEGRLVFPHHTVLDNLRLGAFGRRDGDVAADLERAVARFPILGERARQRAGTLSGGEQQMLAIARSLMRRPALLLLDEPSLGLAPRLVRELFQTLARLRDDGLTLLLVEQMAEVALEIADRGYVLEQGRIVLTGKAAALLRDEQVTRAYLGRARAEPPGGR